MKLCKFNTLLNPYGGTVYIIYSYKEFVPVFITFVLYKSMNKINRVKSRQK